jgi:hypothetical protein
MNTYGLYLRKSTFWSQNLRKPARFRYPVKLRAVPNVPVTAFAALPDSRLLKKRISTFCLGCYFWLWPSLLHPDDLKVSRPSFLIAPFDISEVVSHSISNGGAIPKVEIEQEEEMATSIVPLSYLNSCAHRPPSLQFNKEAARILNANKHLNSEHNRLPNDFRTCTTSESLVLVVL